VVARPTGRDDLYVLFVKTLLTILFVFLRHSDSAHWLLAFAVFICYSVLAVNFTVVCVVIDSCLLSRISHFTLVMSHSCFSYCFLSISQCMPYYLWSTNVLQCIVSWLLSWASIVLLLVQLTKNVTEPGISLLFFILSPAVVLGTVLYIQV
jgi:hypothetical protein